uniref:Uncharacterized protein n=1 Tax=Triticum urartu TaxID=4572 RepID=A0A8R7PKF8_TRIUA
MPSCLHQKCGPLSRRTNHFGSGHLNIYVWVSFP